MMESLIWFLFSLCRFIILACDGLFKVFSADEAVKFVLNILQVTCLYFDLFVYLCHYCEPMFCPNYPHPCPPQQEESVEQKPGLTEEEVRFEAACQQLASEAVRRGCADNVTVILVSVGS